MWVIEALTLVNCRNVSEIASFFFFDINLNFVNYKILKQCMIGSLTGKVAS